MACAPDRSSGEAAPVSATRRSTAAATASLSRAAKARNGVSGSAATPGRSPLAETAWPGPGPGGAVGTRSESGGADATPVAAAPPTREPSARRIPSPLNGRPSDAGDAQAHPSVSPTSSRAGTPGAEFGDGFRSRYGARNLSELECFHFTKHGQYRRRTCTRWGVLHAAREYKLGVEPPFDQTEAAAAAATGGGASDGDAPPTERSRTWSESLTKKERKRMRKYLRGVLQARDIRQIDPAFVSKPAIWVRRNVIVVSLEHVRALIFAEHLLLFNPRDALVAEAARAIESRLGEGESASDLQEAFEFRALETLLVIVCTHLEQELNELEPHLQQLLEDMTRKLSAHRLEQLRYQKQQLSTFAARAEGIQHVMQELLGEDEDMSRLYLTDMAQNPDVERSVADHEDAEQLLESYLHLLDDMIRRADLLASAVDNTEDLVNIQLGTLRNRLLLVDVTLGILEAVFTAVGFVTGIFTVNLQPPFFHLDHGSQRWFIGVVVSNTVFASVAIGLLLLWVRRSRYVKS